eukprot:scaffold23499_cov109-Cylindrotheca_fusiformis.AAC.9
MEWNTEFHTFEEYLRLEDENPMTRKVTYRSAKEKSNAWLHPRDYVEATEFELQLRTWLSIGVQKGRPSRYSLSSLGFITGNDRRTLLAASRTSVQAVLMEQDRQPNIAIYAEETDPQNDAFLISAIYSLHAKQACHCSRIRGFDHAAYVQNVGVRTIDCPPQTPRRVLRAELRNPCNRAPPTDFVGKISYMNATA